MPTSGSDQGQDASAARFARTDDGAAAYIEKITTLPTETVLDDIRQCKFLATYAVPSLTKSPEQRAYLHRLMEGGLVSIVLDLLKNCDGEPPIEFRGEGKGGEHIDSPAMWVGLLLNVVGPPENRRYCAEIAEGIEPLVKCMRDDRTRQLFQSSEHWYATYGFFVILLCNLINFEQVTAEVLLQYEGCLAMIVQVQFWGEKYRPDLLEGPHAETYLVPRLPDVKHAAMRFLYMLFAIIRKQVGGPRGMTESKEVMEDEKKRLFEIGTTPIVNDPDCSVVFVKGLLELVQSTTDSEAKQIWYYMLCELAISDCVDAEVIRAVVDLKLDFESDMIGIDADQLPRLAFRMLHVPSFESNQIRFLPSDARYATAINAGLIQMCFRLLFRLGDRNNGEICGLLALILQGGTAVAFHPKTNKAVSNACGDIRKLLELIHSPLLPQPAFLFTPKCQQILEMIAFFGSDIHEGPEPLANGQEESVSCRNCSKVLEEDAIKRCSRCKTTYCSRECQVTHWKQGGHKAECKKKLEKSGINLKMTGFEGTKKDQLKVEAQADNIVAAAREMLMDNTGAMLRWTVVNDVEALDCVVVIDFRAAPPSFNARKVSELRLADLCGIRSGHPSEVTIKKDIACNRAKGAISGVLICVPPSTGGNDDSPCAVMCTDFPGSHLVARSWPAAQAQVKEEMAQEGWRPGLSYPIG